MTILLNIASTRPSHGGTSRSVAGLANALSERGHELHLVTANPPGIGRPEELSDDVAFHNLEERGWFRGTFRSLFFYRGHLKGVVDRVRPDFIHDHGAWLPANRAAAGMAGTRGIPLVITPHGALTRRAFAQNGLKKRLAWAVYQKRIIDKADLIHVTSPGEKEDLESWDSAGEIARIPWGIHPPPKKEDPIREEGKNRRLLLLSRLAPIKGIPMLLEAWRSLDTKGWTLEIAGPAEASYRNFLQTLVAKQPENNVRLSGEVKEQEKWRTYRSADLFVLPSYSENFGLVVAEALASGVPVVTTRTTPWSELPERECGWWVEPEIEPLREALREALTKTDEELREMGQRGRRLVEEKYSWNKTAEMMEKAYQQILER